MNSRGTTLLPNMYRRSQVQPIGIPCHFNGWLPAFLLAQGFQIAAPGGFSAIPAHPAHTVSGLAAGSEGRTRSHHR